MDSAVTLIVWVAVGSVAGGAAGAGIMVPLIARQAKKNREQTVEFVRALNELAHPERAAARAAQMRKVYLDFWTAVEEAAGNPAAGHFGIQAALGQLRLEGPDDVYRAAERLVDALGAGDHAQAREDFLTAARAALVSR